MGLTAEFALSADFARDAGYFASEGVELIHHRVNGVLEFKNFAFYVYRDLARQIAASHGRSHFSNVSHLSREVSGHGVDGVRKILPSSRHSRDNGLAAEFAVSANLAGYTRHF